MSQRVFHIPDSLNGQTLVAALRGWQSQLSWRDAKELLTSRRVSVNGAICVDHGRRIKSGDVVHLFDTPRTPQPTADDVELLYCDPQVVVVVKPALMTTLRHNEERNWPAARKNLQPTLDEVLPRLVQEWERPGRSARGGTRNHQRGGRPVVDRSRGKLPRVIAVHRLDRDTSGVMVFARTPAAEQHLVRQFKQHSNERVYQAVVHGHPAAQTFDTHFIRDRGDGLRGSSTNENEGEHAVTHVRPLERLGEYSLVECVLETGRTHQIRIHLSEAGHLVCGDPIYRKRLGGPPVNDASGAPRLALHAAQLAFDHPATAERLDFEASLPDDLERFVTRLRQRGK
ncbi:MAG: RluA family pseudouridine synthase [Planctomycetaceae bacterium]|nr:RluA family pseudouridine synthase [Planctomycetaceae bacterium]